MRSARLASSRSARGTRSRLVNGEQCRGNRGGSFVLVFRGHMKGISQLRLGRSMQTRAKRARIRKRKPRFNGKSIKSDFRAPPRMNHFKQPYLSTDAKISDLIK